MIISARATPTATATPPAYDAADDASTTKAAVVFVAFVPCRNITDKSFNSETRFQSLRRKETLSALKTSLNSEERPDDTRIVYSLLRILQLNSLLE